MLLQKTLKSSKYQFHQLEEIGKIFRYDNIFRQKLRLWGLITIIQYSDYLQVTEMSYSLSNFFTLSS